MQNIPPRVCYNIDTEQGRAPDNERKKKMKKLEITSKMSMNEQRARMIVNHTIESVTSENQLKNWLLDQVTGLVIDGMVLTYAWLSYGAAVAYFNEATGRNVQSI